VLSPWLEKYSGLEEGATEGTAGGQSQGIQVNFTTSPMEKLELKLQSKGYFSAWASGIHQAFKRPTFPTCFESIRMNIISTPRKFSDILSTYG